MRRMIGLRTHTTSPFGLEFLGIPAPPTPTRVVYGIRLPFGSLERTVAFPRGTEGVTGYEPVGCLDLNGNGRISFRSTLKLIQEL